MGVLSACKILGEVSSCPGIKVHGAEFSFPAFLSTEYNCPFEHIHMNPIHLGQLPYPYPGRK